MRTTSAAILALTLVGIAAPMFSAAQTTAPSGTRRDGNLLFIRPGQVVKGTITRKTPVVNRPEGLTTVYDGAYADAYYYQPKCMYVANLTIEMTGQTNDNSLPQPGLVVLRQLLDFQAGASAWARAAWAQAPKPYAPVSTKVSISASGDMLRIYATFGLGATGTYELKVTESFREMFGTGLDEIRKRCAQ